jgi:hypothetical protein
MVSQVHRPWAALAAGVLLVMGAGMGAARAGVVFEPGEGRVVVKLDGELLTELRYQEGPKPFFYPLLGPGGVALSRHYPMKPDTTDEAHDHPHHRSLWFTHGDVNGVDFWAEGPTRGKVVQHSIREWMSGGDEGHLVTSNRWVAPDGRVLVTDRTKFRVVRSPLGRQFDYEITLFASEGQDVVFGDTKEGTMAIRLAESMRLKANKHYEGKATGRILQDTGVKDGATWGKRAAWTAYAGPVGTQTYTVTIFDHPSNPRYPTWWHVRDYGLFAANPFGIHDFERKAAGTGNLTVKAGESVRFRYRFLMQEGEPKPAQLAEVAAVFAAVP